MPLGFGNVVLMKLSEYQDQGGCDLSIASLTDLEQLDGSLFLTVTISHKLSDQIRCRIFRTDTGGRFGGRHRILATLERWFEGNR